MNHELVIEHQVINFDELNATTLNSMPNVTFVIGPWNISSGHILVNSLITAVPSTNHTPVWRASDRATIAIPSVLGHGIEATVTVIFNTAGNSFLGAIGVVQQHRIVRTVWINPWNQTIFL